MWKILEWRGRKGSKPEEEGHGEKRKMRQLPKEQHFGIGVWEWHTMFQEDSEVVFYTMCDITRSSITGSTYIT